MKHIAILLFALAAAPTAASAQTPEKTVSITVENTWDKAKTDEPVVIRLADLKPGFEVRSATVYRGSTGGRPARLPFWFCHSASLSWMKAESRSMTDIS